MTTPSDPLPAPFVGETLLDTLIQAVRTVAAQAAAIREAAGGSLTDQLATCLTAALSAAWLQPAPSPNPNPNPPTTEPASTRSVGKAASSSNPQFQALSHLLILLRRGDHYVEWLKIQRQRLEFSIQKYHDHLAALKAKTEPDRSRVRPDGGPTKEFVAQLIKDLNLM